MAPGTDATTQRGSSHPTTKGNLMADIPDISGINDLMKTINALLGDIGSTSEGGSQFG